MPIEMPRGLPFAVDTWTPASSLKRHRFLTHAHRDHLAGITTTAAAIYASRLTILITLRIFPHLDRASFVELQVGAPPLRVPDPDGDFTVTAFDANHCPGAVMFLFEGAFGTVLHTGDCRLTPGCLPNHHASRRRIDYVFLDCTFARCPLHFPTKEDSIRQVIDCIRRHPNAPAVYLACDMLGQEDVLVEVSRAFGAKIHVDRDTNPDCHHTLSLVAPDILLSDDAAASSSSRFHVMAAFPKLSDRVTEILALARARRQPEPLIIRPSSQWYAYYEASLHRRPVLTEPMRDEFGVWHVCLSMHSSRDELELALGILQPRWVVSTTPPCLAMDISYVRKHCSLSPDDPLWKLLGITAAAGMMPTVTGSPVDKSEVPVTCSPAEEEFGSTQVDEVAAEVPTGLLQQGFEVIRVEPPPAVTLFGSARFGLLESESHQLWKDEYQSVEVIDDVEETEAMDSAAIEPGGLSKDSMAADNSTEVTEVAASVRDSSSTESESQKHGKKSDGQVVVIDSTEDERLLRPELRKAAATEYSGSRTFCREGKNNNKDEADDCTAPLEETDQQENSGRASDSSAVIGSSEHLSANLRRLYRSMNVPVPRPLPSLVELMAAASKRPRVSQL